jgi:hypothetical protein
MLEMNKGQAEIHMMALAEAMWDAYNESTPKKLNTGEWHIPYSEDLFSSFEFEEFVKTQPEVQWLTADQHDKMLDDIALKISTARCARTSYTVVGTDKKQNDYLSDVNLHNHLRESGHWSPFEYCAQAMDWYKRYDSGDGGWSGNFRGFIQYRKKFHGENKENKN